MADETSDNLQPWAIATTASVTGMALLSVLLRLLSRYERKQKLWWDDWMIIMSMVGFKLASGQSIANTILSYGTWL